MKYRAAGINVTFLAGPAMAHPGHIAFSGGHEHGATALVLVLLVVLAVLPALRRK
jgi:hypothetical protein